MTPNQRCLDTTPLRPPLLKGGKVCHFPPLSLEDLAINDKKMIKHNKSNFMDVN